MLTRLGRFTVRRRRLVLSITVLFMVAAAVLGTGVFGVLQGGGFEDPSSESARALEILDERFDAQEPSVIVLVTATEGDVDEPAVAAAATALTDRLSSVDHVADASSYWDLGSPPPLRSSSGDRALIPLVVTGDEEQVDAAVETLREVVDESVDPAGPISVQVGGRDAAFADIGATIEGDLARAELVAIPLTLILLVLVFGGLVAASLPLLVGVVAVLGTFLSLLVIGSITNVSIYAINLTTALGLGLAIDYSLFVVGRYREELRNGRSVEDAVVRSVQTAGRTILISALTVAVSLSALLVFPQYFLRSFAYAGIAVVLIAMVSSIVTLPALLAVVGRRIDSLRVLPVRAQRREEDGFWYRSASRVMKRPLPIALAVVAVLLLLGAPFLRAEFGTPDDRVLPTNVESRQVNDVLREDFAGNASEAFPVLIADASPAERDRAIDLIGRLDGVERVETTLHEAGDIAWVSVVPAVEMGSGDGQALVRDIRSLDIAADVSVGGSTAELVDSKAAIASRLPVALAIIAVATTILLFLLSGSLLVPLKALILNMLSLTATFGALVWIFQDGNLSGPLGFTATGALDISMPILMFCIAFGLSMDYEVFLLSRIKEEHDRTGDNDRAVALGLERTGRIVTAAALLLSITFFAFATSGVSFIKMFGLGLGLAVLMDAFVIRGTLVPAFMKLAGEWNWWAPRRLRALHDRFGINEAETPTEHESSEHESSEHESTGPESTEPAAEPPPSPPEREAIASGTAP
jgi:RND superfamily putative drug exporter